MKRRIISMVLAACMLVVQMPNFMDSHAKAAGSDQETVKEEKRARYAGRVCKRGGSEIGIPILNKQTSQDESFIRQYVQNADNPPDNLADFSASASAFFKYDSQPGLYECNIAFSRCAVFTPFYPPLMYIDTYGRFEHGRAWKCDWKMKKLTDFQNGMLDELRKTGQLYGRIGAKFTFCDSQPYVKMDNAQVGGNDLVAIDKRKIYTQVEPGKWSQLSKSGALQVETGGDGKGTVSEFKALWVALADKMEPTVKGISVYDAPGSQKYICLDMGEPLRPANDKINDDFLKKMKLTLRAANRSSGVETVLIHAFGVSQQWGLGGGDNGLWFQTSDLPDNCDLQITGIESFSTGVEGMFEGEIIENGEYLTDLYGAVVVDEYRKPGTTSQYYNLGNPVKMLPVKSKSTTPITDMAGNAFKIGRMSLTQYQLVIDAKAPEVSEVKISGNMISSSSTQEGPPDSWPADIDRSSMFAGAGDKITFRVILNEQCTVSENTKLELNMTDGGVPVQVALDKTEIISGGVNGTDSTQLVFKPLIITADMKAENPSKPISSVKLAGNIKDTSGNPTDSLDISQRPRQQVYLDNEAPSVKAGPPLSDSSDDKVFAIPLTFSDGTGIASGFIGLDADLAWISDTPISYEYAVTDSSDTPKAYSGRAVTGTMDTKSFLKLDLPKDTMFLHIKILDDRQELFPSKLVLRTRDWAGNIGEITSNVDYSFDHLAPVLECVSMNTDYSPGKAVLDGQVKVTESTDVTVRYQWSDTGEPDESAWQPGELSDHLLSVQFNLLDDSAAHTKYLLVTAVDKAGNKSELGSFQVKVDFTKAKSLYRIESDLSQLDSNPVVKLSGPVETEEATTRVTLAMGDKSYVRIFAAGEEEANIFDFTGGTWMQVEENNGKYENVHNVEDPLVLSNYYGSVSVRLETAGETDLTPVQGGDVVPVSDPSYCMDGSFAVKYAPVVESVHSITFGEFMDTDGNKLAVSGSPAHVMLSDNMTGVRIPFTVSNVKWSEWNFENIDFDRSYAVLVKTDNEGSNPEEVSKHVTLSNGTSQVFSVPAEDKDGKPFNTGAYQVWVKIYQKGNNQPVSSGCETYIVLDATQIPSNTGLRGYETRTEVIANGVPGYSEFIMVNKVEDTGEPIGEVNLGFASEVVAGGSGSKNEEFGYYSGKSGTSVSRLSFLAEGKVIKDTEPILGEKIGYVSGIRIWNKESPGGKELPFGGVGRYDLKEPRVHRLEIVNESQILTEEVLKMTEASGDEIYFKTGGNTICYQLQMGNGKISPIYETQVNISTTAPTLTAEYQLGPNYTSETPDGKSIIKTQYIDLVPDEAFSAGGGLKYYVYTRRKDDPERWEKNVWDPTKPFRLSENSYGTGEWNTVNEKTSLKYVFVAVDSYGNATTVIPQMGQAYRYLLEPVEAGVGHSYWMDGEKGYTFNLDVTAAKSVDISLDNGASVKIPLPEGGQLYRVMFPQNSAGLYSWMYRDSGGGKGTLTIQGAYPYDSNKPENEKVAHSIKISANGVLGDVAQKDIGFEVVNTKPDVIEENIQDSGKLVFNTYVKMSGGYDFRDVLYSVPIYGNGVHNVRFQDLFGSEYTSRIEVSGIAEDPAITISETEPTANDVTVTVTSQGYNLNLTEYTGKTTITGNDSNEVTAVVRENTNLVLKYTDAEGEKRQDIYVRNINKSPVEPQVLWSYLPEDVIDGAVMYSVTAYLVNKDGSMLFDAFGNMASHTFYPDGETSYVFKNYRNSVGVKGEDFRVDLPVRVEKPDSVLPDEAKDTIPPSVAVTAWMVQNGVSTQSNTRLVMYDPVTQWINPELSLIEGFDDVSDMAEVIGSLGWKKQYIFQVDIADHNKVRLIAKKGLNAAVPEYTDSSDVMEGVSIAGRTIELSKNSEFTLFVIDKEGNYTAIPFSVSTIGEMPVPVVAQVLSDDLKTVKAFLLPPENMKPGDLSELKMNDPDAKVLNIPASAYNGLYYMEYTANGPYTVNYSYSYKGTPQTGQIKLTVKDVDDQPPVMEGIKWSANHSSPTNQKVIAQMSFDKDIVRVTWANGENADVQVSALGNKVNVLYTEKTPSIALICYSRNGRSVRTELEAVNEIDTVPPNVSITSRTFASDGRSVKYVIHSDETVTFQEGGKQASDFEYTVRANGKADWHFTDLAGNRAVLEMTVNEIVDTPLKLMFNSSAKEEGACADPSDLNLGIGDTLYVKPLRECSISLNNQPPVTVNEGVWKDFKITEDMAGLVVSVRAKDQYGNLAYATLHNIPVPDKMPPAIWLTNGTISAALDKSEAEIQELLYANARVSDNKTPVKDMKITVSYTKPSASGIVPVLYTAADQAGNQAQITGYLQFYGESDLRVLVNGTYAARDEIVHTTLTSQNISVESGKEPYSVSWKSGIKTTAQMKIGAEVLVKGKTDNSAVAFEPGSRGYYTLCVTTQSHVSYLVVLYVK